MSNKRNILLTTMSTLNGSGTYRMNYYYEKQQEGEKKYCNGISAQEPGTKYFLSKYPIDEIVVIGSRETLKAKQEIREAENVQNLLEGWTAENENYIGHDISPYDLYKYRIGCFLNDRNNEFSEYVDGADIIHKLNEVRRKEIENLLQLTIGKHSAEEEKFQCFEVSDLFQKAGEKFWSTLKKEIAEDIRKNFERSEAYEKYITAKSNLEIHKIEIQEKEIFVEQYQELRESIKADKKLTLFEQEYLLMALKSKMTESQLKVDIHKQDFKILELEKEIGRLEYEIGTLKEHRKDSEFAYARYYAFLCLDEKYLLKPLAENCERSNGIKMTFVAEQKESDKEPIDNIKGIVNALYGTGEEEVNLYIDVQGGNRTSGYVRNAVLSILNNQETDRVHICKIIGTNFMSWLMEGSQIVDETARYKITDLVSGMNAFIRYGKADMIQNYCEELGISEESAIAKLVDYMVSIDDAISLCNMTALVENIQGLGTFFGEEQVGGKSAVENIFEILKDGIKRDYGKLLPESSMEEIDYLELISWCNRKGFVQQALTLIEDKMPKTYFDHKVFRFEIIKDEGNRFLEKIGQGYETRKENTIFYSLSNQLNLGYLSSRENEYQYNTDKYPDWDNTFEMVWQLKKRKASGKRIVKSKERELYYSDRKNYIKQVLDSYHIVVPEITQELMWNERKKLIEIREKIEKEEEKETIEEFLKNYCRFHRLDGGYQKKEADSETDKTSGEYNLIDSRNLYDLIKDTLGKKRKWYHTIMNCINKNEYMYKPNRNTKNVINVTAILSTNSKVTPLKPQMEQLFLLHDALKKERNCCNHASEKGVRLPQKVVSMAIEIYVDKARDIIRRCEESKGIQNT